MSGYRALRLAVGYWFIDLTSQITFFIIITGLFRICV
jgi:hypothetical protein